MGSFFFLSGIGLIHLMLVVMKFPRLTYKEIDDDDISIGFNNSTNYRESLHLYIKPSTNCSDKSK